MTELRVPRPRLPMPNADDGNEMQIDAVVDDETVRSDVTPMITPPLPDSEPAVSPGPKHQAAFVNKLYSYD